MTKAQLTAALNNWQAFFVEGKESRKPVMDVQDLAADARQFNDPSLDALASLCVMLEAAWMNGARQVEAELAD